MKPEKSKAHLNGGDNKAGIAIILQTITSRDFGAHTWYGCIVESEMKEKKCLNDIGTGSIWMFDFQEPARGFNRQTVFMPL